MTGNIQFSYPMMSGSMINGDFTITHDGGGYFQYNYTKEGSDVYKLFKPTKISFFSNSMTIEHKYNSNTLYVKYNTIQNNSETFVTTADNIYLNKSIGDGIVITEGVIIKEKTCNLSSKDGNFYIDMSSIGEIPLSYTFDNSTSNPFPTTGLSSIIDISLSPSSFISDEMVCDEGTNNSTAAETKNSYESTVAGNVGLSFGFGFLVLTAVVALITHKQDVLQFTGSLSLFNTEGPPDTHDVKKSLWRKGYVVFYMVAFLLSFSCFMGYGGVLISGSGDKTADLTGLLWTAIVSFLIFVFMVVYKMVMLTKPAV